MRYDAPQFAPTFREEAESARANFEKQHKYIGFLARPVCGLILFAHRIFMYFCAHAKKLSGLALVSAAFVASTSFAFPVLSMRSGFVSAGTDTAYARAVSSAELQVTEAAGSAVAESSVEFSGEDDAVTLVDPTLLDEDYQYHSEGGNDLGDLVSLSDMFVDYDALQYPAVEEDTGFDSGDWNLILVNKQHPIPDDYEMELGNINGSMQCDKRIIGNLFNMFQSAAADGVTLIVCSPFRTHSHQVELFDRKIDRYMSTGLTYMDAYTCAAQAVTVPGTSEHEIGLAIDIVTDGYATLDDGFGETEAGKWLAANSAEYGFILRYPKGKESITGIEYEPWHFRYVGKEAATKITEEKICLEEFWDEYLYR